MKDSSPKPSKEELKEAENHLNRYGVYPEDFISSSAYTGAVYAVTGALIKSRSLSLPAVESKSEGETILCAAIHFDDGNEYVHQPINIKTGFVVSGRRHHNCFASFSAMRSVRGTTDADIDKYPRNHTQGFLTSKDRFIDRKEAATLALETGQIKEPVTILFSEHLY